MNAALVELVDDDRREIQQQRILLQPRGEDALGREEHARGRTELALEPHVPADLATERPSSFVRDPPRHRPRRHAPRLQHEDRSVHRERRRHARRLACARGSGEDQRAPGPNGVEDLGDVGIDRKRVHVSS